MKLVHGRDFKRLGAIAPKGALEKQLQKFLETGEVDLEEHGRAMDEEDL